VEQAGQYLALAFGPALLAASFKGSFQVLNGSVALFRLVLLPVNLTGNGVIVEAYCLNGFALVVECEIGRRSAHFVGRVSSPLRA
jgi:hypothetical protein